MEFIQMPLCIDLYCGLGGWAEGFLSEGWRVRGFDIEAHDYGTGGYPGELILRDVRSIHGSEFRDADCIVGSSPCQEFSYRAMPWKRAKALPPPYLGMELFQAQFRIQLEACEAAGRYIPMVVENVRGAQKWVGRAQAKYGSFMLWGDIRQVGRKIVRPDYRYGDTNYLIAPAPRQLLKQPGLNFHCPEKYGIPSPSFHGAEHEPKVVAAAELVGQKDFVKVAGNDWNEYRRTGKVSPHWRMQMLEQRGESRKGNGSWFGDYKEAKAAGRGSATRYTSSNSLERKKASALIAKIPFPLAQHIARVFKPQTLTSTPELLGSGPIPATLHAENEG